MASLADITVGDRLEVYVNRKTRFGVVETEHSHINIGPVKSKAVGENVNIEILDIGAYAIGECLDEEYIGEAYSVEFLLPAEGDPADRLDDDGDPFTDEWEEKKSDTMDRLPDL